jgi:membrane-bound lytic murein transglycosylase D
MTDTAGEYGLRVDWWIDERADPEKSARAAAVYLRDLYRQFDDWPLALAAYNAGPNRIRRALADSGATTFWELYESAAIPKETRGYVPTFYATLLIASDPAAYGFELAPPVAIDAKRVELEGPVSLAFIAEATGIAEETLRDLNPGLRREIVPPGRAAIRVPTAAAEKLAPLASTLKNDDTHIALCTFTLRGGDTVKRIARAIGTTAETILAMNDLSSSSRVRAGDSLYLPVRSRDLGALLAASENERFYYAVQKGDTLYSIARRHNLTVEELRDLNDLVSHQKLHRGQRLRVTPPRTVTAGGM